MVENSPNSRKALYSMPTNGRGYYLDCDDSFIGIQTAKMYPVFLFKYAVYSTALTSELYRFLLVSGTESSHIPSPQNNSEVNKT